ncbi:hypothetical protein EUX98_g2285 [Antrodiella citrinella]|uniref:F-box domain-containing protein n=1 Tax=Antrodiella citrinella TaxID=2447956 RepID=A0A4S4N280_9APHY|nr:hypothetical protein EUX98_g2285 [Antrodiella citrinella]
MVTLRSENLQSTFPLAHFDSAVFLQLKDMNVAFNTSNLAKLTALAIDNSRSSLPNVVNLISVLRMAPALKSLTLTGRWIPRTAEEQNNLRNTQVFQAQQLKDVHLRTEAAFVREFFSVVSVSASSQIHLHVWAAAGQEGTGTGLNLGDALPDKDRIHHIGCIKSAKILTVTLEGDDEPCLLYFDEVTRGALCIYPTLARIPDAFHWQDVVDQCVDAMEQLALSTVSERITTLSLRDDPFGHLAALDLYSLFHSLPNLRILLVKARRIDTVLDALRALEMDSKDQFGVLCQKLAAIRLEDLVVDENVVNQIVACFETRMDVSECDLQALHMGGSDVDAELLEMLESICQRVRV